MDGQHRIIFDLINDLHDAVEAGRGREILQRTMLGLVSYSAMHFRMEEELMRRHQYPAMIEHLGEHSAFVKQVEGFQRAFAGGGESAARQLSDFLKAWLTDHILKIDMKLGAFLKSVGEVEE